MSDQTKIEWCDSSWNPIVGCTPISEGCQHCYAQGMIRRFWKSWGLPSANPGPVLKPEKLNIPLHWRKPRRIFVCSMSDLFHPDIPDDFILKVFEVMANAQLQREHVFMVLTKRPERMKAIMETIRLDIEEQKKPVKNEDGVLCYRMVFSFPLRNIWLGFTAENQRRYNERWEIMQKIPAAVRFASMEPMLGPIEMDPEDHPDWVIVGGETGPGNRPMLRSWVASVSEQCRAANVPYFFKKWGAFEGRMGRELSCLEALELERREYPNTIANQVP